MYGEVDGIAQAGAEHRGVAGERRAGWDATPVDRQAQHLAGIVARAEAVARTRRILRRADADLRAEAVGLVARDRLGAEQQLGVPAAVVVADADVEAAVRAEGEGAAVALARLRRRLERREQGADQLAHAGRVLAVDADV